MRLIRSGLILCFLLTPSLSFALEVREQTLENGLKVLLLEEHKAPVVTFQLWYQVGSRNEVTGKTGLSHLTEHMMFKGTANHGKGEFSRIVAKNGGTENAFTGNDYTAYFEYLSSDRIDLSLELEADRMQNLLVDSKEFELEREVVKEERRSRTDDDPYSFLVEQLYALAFAVHPYRNPVIGWMTDLERLVRDDVFGHYRQYYVPNNATIVVVGDFSADELLPRIVRAFGKIPRGPDPPKVGSIEPPQRGERRSIVKKEAQLPFVFVGYPVPNYTSPDVYPLTVLANLLSAGKSSRLYRGLVYFKQIALDAGGEYEGLAADPQLFYLYGTARPGKRPDEIERALYEEIERISNEPVSEEELQKAKNQVEAGFILGQDSNFFMAMELGMAQTVGAGWRYVADFVPNIRKVTTEDILRVARTYLIEDRRNVGTLIPIRSQPAAEKAETPDGSAAHPSAK